MHRNITIQYNPSPPWLLILVIHFNFPDLCLTYVSQVLN